MQQSKCYSAELYNHHHTTPTSIHYIKSKSFISSHLTFILSFRNRSVHISFRLLNSVVGLMSICHVILPSSSLLSFVFCGMGVRVYLG